MVVFTADDFSENIVAETVRIYFSGILRTDQCFNIRGRRPMAIEYFVVPV
jgi:hypothetical protein